MFQSLATSGRFSRWAISADQSRYFAGVTRDGVDSCRCISSSGAGQRHTATALQLPESVGVCAVDNRPVTWHPVHLQLARRTDALSELLVTYTRHALGCHLSAQRQTDEQKRQVRFVEIIISGQNTGELDKKWWWWWWWCKIAKRWQLSLHCHLKPPVPPIIIDCNHQAYMYQRTMLKIGLKIGQYEAIDDATFFPPRFLGASMSSEICEPNCSIRCWNYTGRSSALHKCVLDFRVGLVVYVGPPNYGVARDIFDSLDAVVLCSQTPLAPLVTAVQSMFKHVDWSRRITAFSFPGQFTPWNCRSSERIGLEAKGSVPSRSDQKLVSETDNSVTENADAVRFLFTEILYWCSFWLYALHHRENSTLLLGRPR